MTRLCHTHALTEVVLSSCCTSEMAQFKQSHMLCLEPRIPHWKSGTTCITLSLTLRCDHFGDAHLLEEFNRYLKTDAALQASDSAKDVWWASKRKELDRQMVAAKSIPRVSKNEDGEPCVQE